ncbi:MAG: 3D domain-containing protein [Pyrinomonadaceae bacterium]|nr:3D domain-containing protein [Pyrinomonadaceae bacterium]
MKNLVRGGAVLSVLALFVAFIYAQTKTMGNDLIIANDSLTQIENNLVDTTVVDNIVGNNLVNTVSADDEKKLVKKTGSSTAAGAGASRGAFTATAYCLQGRTAMGHGVRRGIIAADPRVLKLGSKVVVNAGAWSGTYLVSDTGGGIKGKKIDIWVPGCAEARKFGRRTVQIYSAQ